MPQLERQHKRGGRSGAVTLLRAISLLMVLLLLIALGIYWAGVLPAPSGGWMPAAPEKRFFLPEAKAPLRLVHFPKFSAALDSTGAAVWAACEYDARMTDDWIFPDSLFPRMSDQDLPRWRDWLQASRQAALRLGRLFVVAGPFPNAGEGHYLVWLDEGLQLLEGVGVIFPQGVPVSIDSVEALTDIDFFADYWLDSLEAEVEKSLNLGHWSPEIR